MFDPATTELVTTSGPAELFAAMTAGGTAHVFSFRARTRLSRFPTTHFAGGRRAVLVPAPRPLLLTAAWSEHGVTAWDAGTGELVWQRRDLTHTQHLAFLGGEPEKPIAAIARADGMGWAFSAVDGRTVGSLRTIRELYAAPSFSRFVTAERALVTFRDAKSWSALAAPPLFKQPGRALTLLDAAISAELVVLSRPLGDFGGPRLEAFDHGGLKCWSLGAAPQHQFTRIAGAADGFVAIESKLKAPEHVLVRISAEGKPLERRPLDGPFRPEPFDEGRVLLTPDGRALDAQSLETLWAFDDAP